MSREVSDAPVGRPSCRHSRDAADKIGLGISSDPSGLAKIISRMSFAANSARTIAAMLQTH